jgi:hypothetical protein
MEESVKLLVEKLNGILAVTAVVRDVKRVCDVMVGVKLLYLTEIKYLI